MKGKHTYKIDLVWTGNLGDGTVNYKGYERSHEITTEGKPTLFGSSDTMFRGDHAKWNPEELLLSSISACHMLWYLHLCADHGIIIESYIDNPTAIMEVKESGSGSFTEATLRPTIKITNPQNASKAMDLHKEAHKYCFIANSLNFPVKILPIVNDAI